MRHLLPPHLFLLSLIALALPWAVSPERPALPVGNIVLSVASLVLGVGWLAWARMHFLRKDAEIMTFGDPRALVEDGPFRFSRNPMYLGFLLILVSAAFLLNNWLAILPPLVFWLASAFWYIPFEERALRDAFGPAYDDYAHKTRRWI
ncbi:MAG: S-isoprenylcysteine methyltransferase [Rhodobacterales bacterium]|nr:MAG: S-isoprenylcysteine methyltransferase [Rhodobacterales bacterium]